MAPRFGTDGLRGVAGVELTPELALAVGRAAAAVLCPVSPAGPDGSGSDGEMRPEVRRVVAGRDTRRSGSMLMSALTAGLAAGGVDVLDAGVIPTPGVARLAGRFGCPGAVITASHNPFGDNGIKLFAAGGVKLDGAIEAKIEDLLFDSAVTGGGVPALGGAAIGTITHDPQLVGWYRDELVRMLPPNQLAGVRLVVDCANGAASVTAPAVFAAAGAELVEVVAGDPDGVNINLSCGSSHPDRLAAAVACHRADLGLAFDGDADRLVAVDGNGTVVDGDRLLALFASDLRARGELPGDTVVVTVMSNLGFHQAMAEAGIAVKSTDVGDRHILAALDANGWSLGGEQSGHLVFRRLATTGDGVLSGLLLVDLLKRSGRSLADMAANAMRTLPQVLRNVPVSRRDDLADAAPVWRVVRDVEAELGSSGRVLLRPSGTEPLIRVMVEAPTPEAAAEAAERLASAVRVALG